MKNLNIIYENAHLIAVNKPAGILVLPDQHTDVSKTLIGMVSEYLHDKINQLEKTPLTSILPLEGRGRKGEGEGNTPLVIYRMEKDSSGIALFAKNAASHKHLCAQFDTSEAVKKYIALLRGFLIDDSGTIDKPILIDGMQSYVAEDGNRSITTFKVLEHFRTFTFVEAEAKTGISKQVRIHLRSIGHPLAVDPEFFSDAALNLSAFKKRYKPTGTEKPLISRLSLHLSSIAFKDPNNGKKLFLESPLPEDFELALKMLRKYDQP